MSLLSDLIQFCPACQWDKFQAFEDKYYECEKCGFRLYVNMAASVAVLIMNEKDELLFTVRRHNPEAGKLDLPGGFIDLGETAEEAVTREISEELNLEVSSFSFRGTFPNVYDYRNVRYQTLDLVFRCTVRSFDPIRAADDVSGYVFIPVSDINIDQIGLQSVKNICRKLKAEAGYA